MIFIFFAYINAGFGKTWANENAEIQFFTENQNVSAKESFYGQPKFNASCNSDSLDAAVECEDRIKIKF